MGHCDTRAALGGLLWAYQGEVHSRVLLLEVRQGASPVTRVPAQVLPAVLRNASLPSAAVKDTRQSTSAAPTQRGAVNAPPMQ